MNKDKELAIVIPTFNRVETTLSTISALKSGTYKNFKILICDSCSTDGTIEKVSKHEEVIVINSGRDSWWTASVNVGIKKAIELKFKNILIINDDIKFNDNFLLELYELSTINKNFIIGPLQKYGDNYFIGSEYIGIFKFKRNININNLDHTLKVSTSNGCCLFVPRHIFEEVGFFDEINCPHLAGDVEFQLRAKRLGFSTMVSPKIVIEQLPPTNYLEKIKISTILSDYGSPYRLSAYMQLGKTLYGSDLKFYILGIFMHIKYTISVIKAVLKKITYR